MLSSQKTAPKESLTFLPCRTGCLLSLAVVIFYYVAVHLDLVSSDLSRTLTSLVVPSWIRAEENVFVQLPSLSALSPAWPTTPDFKASSLFGLEVADRFLREGRTQSVEDLAQIFRSHLFDSDLHKAYAIYRFVTEVVTYVPSDPESQDPSIVLSTGVGVCAGYALLYVALGNQSGLSVRYVGGVARGWKDDFEEVKQAFRDLRNETKPVLPANLQHHTHAWVIVTVGGREYFVDPTWGDGAGHKGVLDSFEPSWFARDPRASWYTHVPAKREDLILSSLLENVEEVFDYPVVFTSGFRMGLQVNHHEFQLSTSSDEFVRIRIRLPEKALLRAFTAKDRDDTDELDCRVEWLSGREGIGRNGMHLYEVVCFPPEFGEIRYLTVVGTTGEIESEKNFTLPRLVMYQLVSLGPGSGVPLPPEIPFRYPEISTEGEQLGIAPISHLDGTFRVNSDESFRFVFSTTNRIQMSCGVRVDQSHETPEDRPCFVNLADLSRKGEESKNVVYECDCHPPPMGETRTFMVFGATNDDESESLPVLMSYKVVSESDGRSDIEPYNHVYPSRFVGSLERVRLISPLRKQLSGIVRFELITRPDIRGVTIGEGRAEVVLEAGSGENSWVGDVNVDKFEKSRVIVWVLEEGKWVSALSFE